MGLKQAWRRYISQGVTPEATEEQVSRTYFFNAFTLIGVASSLIFGLVNFAHGKPVIGAIEVAGGVLAIANLLLFWKTGNLVRGASVVVAIMFVLLTFLLFRGGLEGTGAYWFATFPILTFFLLGKKTGLKWMGSFFLVLGLCWFASQNGALSLYYSPVEIRQLAASLFAVSAMTYVYAWTVIRYRTLMEERNEALEREVVIREKTAEELERALRSEKQFLASVSHEIRTPLNAILGFIDLLEQTRLDPTQREYLKDVVLSSRHLGQLINDVLDVSKLEAKQLELAAAETDLTRVLREAVSISAAGLEPGVAMEMDVPDFSYAYRADSVRIRQIFLNLLENAAKFTKEGSVRLVLDAMKEEETATRFRFTVEDTGTGVAPDRRGELFKPFKQGDAVTEKVGTGLGLYLSRSLARMMGGEITFAPRPGGGSRFTVELLLAKSGTPLHSLREERGEETAGEDFSALKILMVEDVEMNVKLAREMLKTRFNASFDLASNGEEGVEMAAKNRYDLIFMDIQMPVMDGFQATRKIRKSDPDVPIFAMSANAMAEDARQAQEVGMNGYITKPIRSREVADALRSAGNGGQEMAAVERKEEKTTMAQETSKAEVRTFFADEYGEEMADELLETALENMEEYMALTEAGMENGDMEGLERGFHSLKGIMLGCGLGELGAEASALTQRVRAGEGAEAVKEEKEELFRKIRNFLES